MSSREPDPRRNALSRFLPEPPVNALPAIMAQDATRVAPPPPAAPPPAPRRDTIRAAPERGWFEDLQASAARWMREHKVPSVTEYPPIKLLTMLLGEDPMSSIGGPGKAISSFAARSPRIAKLVADPDFAQWVMRHGPSRGTLRNAPEGVLDDLYQRYVVHRSAQDRFVAESAKAEAASRAAGNPPYIGALPFRRR